MKRKRWRIAVLILAWLTVFTAVACVRTQNRMDGFPIPMAKAANRWTCCVKRSFGDIEQFANVVEYTERSVKTGGGQICFGREAENKTVESDFHCAIFFDGFQYEIINRNYKANRAVIKSGVQTCEVSSAQEENIAQYAYFVKQDESEAAYTEVRVI